MTASVPSSQVTDDLLTQVQAYVEKLGKLSSSERLSPDTLNAVYALAFHQIQQGRIQQAREYLALLLVYAPTDPRFLSAMAYCCEKDGDDDEAIQLYSLALYIAPQSCQLALALAESLTRRGMVDTAVQLFEQIVKQGTAEVDAKHRSRAELWLQVLTQKNRTQTHADPAAA